MRLLKSKRGFFFIVDLILAIIILVTGIIIIFSQGATNDISYTISEASQDFSDTLAYTTINEYRDDVKYELLDASVISTADQDKSLLTVIVQLYNQNETTWSEWLLGNITENQVAQQHNIAFYINDTQIYNRTQTYVTEDAASVRISAKKVIEGVYENRTAFGPYVTEVRVW